MDKSSLCKSATHTPKAKKEKEKTKEKESKEKERGTDNRKTYMAHHQGLSLLSINNLINKNILVKRFMKNPEIEGIKILLQERMPEKAIITKEKKEKIEKLKPKDYENYYVWMYDNNKKLHQVPQQCLKEYLLEFDAKHFD